MKPGDNIDKYYAWNPVTERYLVYIKLPSGRPKILGSALTEGGPLYKKKKRKGYKWNGG